MIYFHSKFEIREKIVWHDKNRFTKFGRKRVWNRSQSNKSESRKANDAAREDTKEVNKKDEKFITRN